MICVSIREDNFEKTVSTIKSVNLMDAGLLEINLDRYKFSDQQVRYIFSMPGEMIAVCRPGTVEDEKRLQILKTALDWGADYVDLEVDSEDNYSGSIIEHAREKGKKVIISYHNHETTPPEEELKKALQTCFRRGANIAKIACLTSNHDEAARMMSIYQYFEKSTIISIGMGEEGKITRIAAQFLGAPFTYASAREDKNTAQGQLEFEKMKRIIREIY